jgi:hypothetical protein
MAAVWGPDPDTPVNRNKNGQQGLRKADRRQDLSFQFVRPRAAWSLLALFCAGAMAQSEIQGGAGATGSPVPKAVSVSQGALSAADKDGRNFLHSNMS